MLMEGATVKKIGVLYGMENTFPGALIERINAMKLPDITAESVKVGGVMKRYSAPHPRDSNRQTKIPR